VSSGALPEPSRRPPPGVPRWLWPPPGAVVRRVVLREEATPDGTRTHVVEGTAPERPHLRALQWLVGEYPRDDEPASVPAVVDVLLEIARTTLPGGKVGHAYALNGQALGAPGNHGARGVVWRYAIARLGEPAPDFEFHDYEEL
jgi:hypothetical protein